ncbi:hypothetical protein C8R44DRAFT_749321 [Mycena epipterygia]|nr:hypothetical protein C8R44DRAFT_749321 [Mycena epipterygia]
MPVEVKTQKPRAEPTVPYARGVSISFNSYRENRSFRGFHFGPEKMTRQARINAHGRGTDAALTRTGAAMFKLTLTLRGFRANAAPPAASVRAGAASVTRMGIQHAVAQALQYSTYFTELVQVLTVHNFWVQNFEEGVAESLSQPCLCIIVTEDRKFYRTCSHTLQAIHGFTIGQTATTGGSVTLVKHLSKVSVRGESFGNLPSR